MATGLAVRSSAGSHPFAELHEFLVVVRDIVDHREMIQGGQGFRGFLGLSLPAQKRCRIGKHGLFSLGLVKFLLSPRDGVLGDLVDGL